MQVINNPVQKIAAAAVTRQSVSIRFPKVFFRYQQIKRAVDCQFAASVPRCVLPCGSPGNRGRCDAVREGIWQSFQGVPGVALLQVGLALLPGTARAAEPSYDDYVAQVRAGKIEIDYTAFRLAYAASPKYAPYGTIEIVS